MPRGPTVVPREAQAQPDGRSTKKSQKRGFQKEEYDPRSINNELDYLHERLNLIVVESAALTDLSGSATLANVITRVNELTAILRTAGLIRSE